MIGVLRRFLVEERAHAAGLLLLTAGSIALSLTLVDQTIRCDEAMTYLDYVRQAIGVILTDYSSPNNHILHSIAAKVCTYFLGPRELGPEAADRLLPVLRLPALIGGTLLVPACYLMLRSHFDRATAMLGTALVATCPYMVDQAVNARGYSMLNTAFLLLLALAPRLVGQRTWGPWLLFGVIAALGTYTIPTMGYPIAIVLTWLAISGLVDLERSEWGAYAVRIAAAIAITLALTLLLYSPALVAPDRSVSFIDDGSKFDLSVRERSGMHSRMLQWLTVVWTYLTHGLNPVYAWATVVVAIYVLYAGRRGFGLRLLSAAVLGFFVLLSVLGRRPPLWSMSFLVPLYWTAVAAGFVFLVRRFVPSRAKQRAVLGAVLLAVTAEGAWACLDVGRRIWSVPWYFGYFDAEEASLRIDEDLAPECRIFGIGRELIAIRFYQELRGDKRSGNMDRDPLEVATCGYLVDSGVPRSAKVEQAMESFGFGPNGWVLELEHSRIVGFERPAELALSREEYEAMLRAGTRPASVQDDEEF